MQNKLSKEISRIKKIGKNIFVKIFLPSFIVLTILFSLYSPQSPVSNIERALAASPTVGNVGAEATGTGAVTPVWPTHVAGDVALLFVETANQAVTLSTPAGFTEITPQQGTGSAGLAGGTRLAVFWNRATSSSMTNPVVADSGDHQYARIITFEGVIDSGNPYDVVAGDVTTPADIFATFPSVTTTVANDLIVLAAAVDRDSATVSFSDWANANLEEISEAMDLSTTVGAGGGLAVAAGTKLTAGATGTTTGTLISSVTALMTIALKPSAARAAESYTARLGNIGGSAASTAAIGVTWPTHVAGDVALLFVETANQAVTLSTPAGFTEITPQQGTGTAAAAGATRLAVFWNRATSSSMASPTVADSGDHQYARIITFKGVIDSGNPYDVVAGSVKAAASTTTTFDAVTTTVDNDLVVLAAAIDRDSATESFSGLVNANLDGVSKAIDYGTTSGAGGGLTIATGKKLTAGNTGTSTGTLLSSVTTQMTIALKPASTVLTTTLSTGTNPGNSTIAPGAAITSVDGFTLTTSSGTDAITTVTVNLSSNSGVGTLSITNSSDTVLGSIGGGTGSGIISGSNSISITSTNATTSGTQFKIKVTPLSHAGMPFPPGSTYSITAVATDWTGTNTKAGQATDTSSTLTIDNASPAGTTGATATAGDAHVDLNWVNPADGDFSKVIIYCKTSSISDAPTEGSDPSVDGTACDGTARVKYSGATSPQAITGLTNGTTYYFRIYARDTNGNFTANANTQEVSAAPAAAATIPTVTTDFGSFAFLSDLTTVQSGGNVTSNGGATVTVSGMVWDTSPNPTVALSTKTTNGWADPGVWTSVMTGLSLNTFYYSRAYATNSVGTGYGLSSTFRTQVGTVPTVTTPTSTSIAGTTATLGANVTSLGNPASISARGVCYATTANPTTPCVAEGSTTTGVFTKGVTGLTVGTTYYYRGYATNLAGTAYSADGTFTTLIIPTVTSPTSTSVTDTTAILGANVTSLGIPASITKRGTCVGTSSTPRSNCVDEGGTTTGVFTQARTGLTASTLYYYAGYAKNSTGYGYTADGTFTTDGTPAVPTVTTPTSSSVTSTSVTLGANVTSLGTPASITERGTCYSTSPTPRSNCAVEGGTTTGVFTHSRSSLTPGTLYYYAGYAKNSTGYGYTTDGTFTTNATTPTLTTTTPATSITTTTAVGSGNISSNGGATVTVSGLVWDTSINPTIALSTKTTDGWAIGGPWTSINPMTGLTAGTLYHYRAYATNSAGTSYGADVTFTTTAIYSLTVNKDGTGTGTVVSSPAGIDCGLTCIYNYTSGTSVTLTATPAGGNTFAGWAGSGCSGTGTCVITVDSNKSATATFNLSGGTLPITGTFTSSVFDSAITGGAAFNSIMWKGTAGTGRVRFQFAASSANTGSWTYYGDGGAGCGTGVSDYFDSTGPNNPVELKGSTCVSNWKNKRYYRYKLKICSNDCLVTGTTSPTVTNVIVNWSP